MNRRKPKRDLEWTLVDTQASWGVQMSDVPGGFLDAAVKTARGVAMTSAAGIGASAGVSVGNSIIAAGLGAACSPFALVLPLAVGGAYGVYRVFKAFGVD